MHGAGAKQWFTAAELAELRLPGLPRAKRKINERASDERWALRTDENGAPLARPRAGRGGGLEYHISMLPAAARIELVKRDIACPEAQPRRADDQDFGCAPHSGSWSWYDRQSQSVKAEAERRLRTVERVEALQSGDLTRSAAIACVAGESGVASSTLWDWLRLVAGVDRPDRLPHLAPRRAGGGAEAEVDEGAWRFLLSDYLRPERPTWSSCYRRMVEHYTAPRGIAVPHSRTLLRKLEREIDGRVIVARREGADALRKTLPPQKRSVADLQAMELMNIDGHKFDVFCEWPDANGQPGRRGRPIMVAIQDVWSRKILAWRIGETESAVLTRLAFADLFRNWGIPAGCVLDNGRAFASKWITGGAKSRFKFKIKDEEPTGILTALGVRPHWTWPFRGQSKPIERAFRDLAEAVKDPRLAGAWTGNHIDNKPENHGSRAVPIERFVAVMDELIRAHNARPGRRTEAARGQSFDQVFEAAYARLPIGKASPEQLRLALLAAEQQRADRQSGTITLMGNRYWSPEVAQIAGQLVTVRFDPDDLTLPIHVYDSNGRFLATVPVLEQTGFLDAEAAQKRARQERELQRHARRLIEVEGLMSADQLAAFVEHSQSTGLERTANPDSSDERAEPISPRVIRPIRHRATAGAARAAAAVEHEPPAASFIDRFTEAERRLRIVNND